MEKHYCAVFIYKDDSIEVEFPDIPECVTFGKTMEEAYEMAVDILNLWIETAEDRFIPKKKYSFKEVREYFWADHIRCEVMIIPINKN